MSTASSHSAVPGTPQTSAKAKVAALISALATAISVALAAYFTGTDEIGQAGTLSALGSGLVSGLMAYLGTYSTKNEPTVEGTH